MTLLWLVPTGAYRAGEDENNEVLNEEPNLHAGSPGDALLKDASKLAYAWRHSKASLTNLLISWGLKIRNKNGCARPVNKEA